MGLATDQEIHRAIATLKCANPVDFQKPPNSVTMVPLGEGSTGFTDWSTGNITLNSDLYGDFQTPVFEPIRTVFLQTLAHEMLHVNESLGRNFVSNLFRMENPIGLGYFHNLLDEKERGSVRGILAMGVLELPVSSQFEDRRTAGVKAYR